MLIKAKLQDVKRSLILDAAAAQFEALGYEQFKIADLAKSVGVSVGTIYGMFESKEGLYMAYVRAQIAGYLAELESQCEEVHAPEEKLKAVFALKFGHFVSKRRAVEECARNNPLFFSNIHYREAQLLERVYAKIAEIVREINPALGREEGRRTAYLLIGLSDGYLSYWLAQGGDLQSQAAGLHTQMLAIVKGC